jgi:ATP-dependent Clp protease ATP-binding subunit ClpA
VTIELSPEASEWLIEHGYDEKFGARPMARVIQEHIKKPLAEELLFGRLENGGTVRVIVEETEGRRTLGFTIIESRPKPKKSAEDDDDESDDDAEGEKAAKKPKAKAKAKRPPSSKSGPRGQKKPSSPRSGSGSSGDGKTSLVPKVPLIP